MSAQRNQSDKSEKLIIESACLRHALDEHVDALSQVLGQLRDAAGLPPWPDDTEGRSDDQPR